MASPDLSLCIHPCHKLWRTAMVMACFMLSGCALNLETKGRLLSHNETNGDAQEMVLERQTNHAMRHIKKGRWAKAETKLQEIVADYSDYAPAHNALGDLYLRRGQFYSAAIAFDRAHVLLPDQPEPLNNLGLVHEKAGRLDEATSYYNQARMLAPTNQYVLGNLARIKVQQDEWSEELKTLLKEVVFLDTRPAWRQWASETLAIRSKAFDIAAGVNGSAEEQNESGEASSDSNSQPLNGSKGAVQSLESFEVLPLPEINSLR
jgi:Tfp pilus assembly protein PilF